MTLIASHTSHPPLLLTLCPNLLTFGLHSSFPKALPLIFTKPLQLTCTTYAAPLTQPASLPQAQLAPLLCLPPCLTLTTHPPLPTQLSLLLHPARSPAHSPAFLLHNTSCLLACLPVSDIYSSSSSSSSSTLLVAALWAASLTLEHVHSITCAL